MSEESRNWGNNLNYAKRYEWKPSTVDRSAKKLKDTRLDTPATLTLKEIQHEDCTATTR